MVFCIIFILLILIAILISINISIKCKNTIFIMGGMHEEDTAVVPNDQVIKNALLSLSSENLDKLIICEQNKLSTNVEEMYKPTIDDKILEIAESIPSPISSPISSPSNGLIIHSTVIQKLSGPRSFYYLKPDYENFISIPESDREKYPLIILFGDRHESFEHICDPCDISNGCYRIDSPEFLQVIDSLAMMAPPSLTPSLTPLPTPSATSNLYIDWFVENSFYGIKFVNGPMEYFTNASISKNILTCYDRSLIGTEEYAEKCPTKHIRWHHGDLRNFGDIYYKDKSIDPKTKYYIAENQPFEIVFNNTVNYHFNKIRKTYPDKNHKIDTFGNRIFTLLEFGEILAHFGDSFDLRNLLKYYFSRIFDEKNNPNSILGKEMRKQNIYYFQDINNWVDFYLNYLAIDSSLLIQEHKLDFINDIKSILNGTMLCCDSDRLQAVFMRFKDILIEMYTILRIFKRNSDDDGKHNQSALSLVYMGNIHISNIKKILLEEFALYTLEKSIIGEGDNLRCLDFSSFRLDLTEELTNRNSHII